MLISLAVAGWCPAFSPLVLVILSSVAHGTPETQSAEIAQNLQWLTAPRRFHWYSKDAETRIEVQWHTFIWPWIRHADLSSVLELAPGAGRVTRKLRRHVGHLTGVDVDRDALGMLRRQFWNDSRVEFHIGNGTSLPMVPPRSITFVLSWDAMVHFHPQVVRAYLHEFSRILVPGGTGFIHHSNLGSDPEFENSPNVATNPGHRSNMTCSAFGEFAQESGLRVVKQSVIDWKRPRLDCLSLFSKP